MAQLAMCAACAGFLPASSPCCPHCDAPVPRPGRAARVAGRLVQVVTGGALAMTLMACYGGAPTEECSSGTDRDYDGSCTPEDCNDDDSSVYPGATEVPGDGIDQDCDGQDTPGGTGGGGAGGSGGSGGNGTGGSGGNGTGGSGGAGGAGP